MRSTLVRLWRKASLVCVIKTGGNEPGRVQAVRQEGVALVYQRAPLFGVHIAFDRFKFVWKIQVQYAAHGQFALCVHRVSAYRDLLADRCSS